MKLVFRPVLGAALSALLILPATARAQTPDTARSVTIDTLVVSVLRTPLDILRAPYAVSVNTRNEIQRAQPGLGANEALFGIPGVQVDNRFNYALGERISIRGFGARSQFGVRGVRVILDGIPLTLPDGQTTLSNVDPGALGRAEVIRGPASALYGNAAGGVIQLTTEAPPEVPLGQEFRVVAGANGLLRTESTTGGQSGQQRYLLRLARLGYDGYRDYNRATNLYATGRWEYLGERDRVALTLNGVDYDAENPGSLSDSLLRLDRDQAFARNQAQQTGESGRQGQLGGVWGHTLGAGELEISGYALARSIDNPIPVTIIALDRRAGGARALYRSDAEAADVPFRWTVGAEADQQRDDRRNYANQQGRRGDLSLNQLEHVRNLAVFAQAVVEPLPRLGVLGGLRYDRVRFSVGDRLVTATNPDDSGERSMDALSPSVGVTYAIFPLLNVYGNVAAAFETPTTTELANRPDGAGGFNPALQPQRATSYEVGARGSRGLVRYGLAVYRADVRDELIPFEVPDAAGRQFFRNSGSATHQGIEASAAAALGAWSARGAYAYTDAAFDSYVVGDRRYDGNRIPGVAPHRVEGTLSYAVAGANRPFATVQTRYQSRTAVNDANTAFSPAYTVTDLRAGLERLRIGGAELAPFVGVTNLFDTDYNTSVVVNAFGGRFFEPGPPRAFYLGAGVGFGVRTGR